MSDVKRYGRTRFDKIKTAFDALRTAVRAHRPEESEAALDSCEPWLDAVFGDDAATTIAALQAENERLREALAPFVTYVHDDLHKGDHRYKLVRTVALGGGWFGAEDFRRARAALRGEGE